MGSTEQVIVHYQREIEKINSRPERALKYGDRLLHCLSKLNKLPVTVTHLQTTGVGKTVNSLRKFQGKNGVNEAAKALVAKWKNMVIEEDGAEDEPPEELQMESRLEDAKKIKMLRQQERGEYSPDDSKGNYDYRPSNSTHNLNSYSPENLSQTTDDSEMKEYSPSKKSHTPNGYSPGSPRSNGIEVYCYSPSKKPEEKRKKSDSKRSYRTESDSGGEMRKEVSSHEKTSQSKPSSSKNQNSSSSKDKPSTSGSGHSSKSKLTKKTVDDDGIDSLSGASFAQALGPMVVKKAGVTVSPKKRPRTEAEETATSASKSSSSSSKSSSSKSGERRSHASSSSGSAGAKPRAPAPSPSAKQLLDDVAGPSHLVPLDMGLVSTLSVPTPNYRPMPQPPLSSAERRQRVQAEEDALERIMSNRNKNSRTKVYSGVKGGLTYVPSLYEICCNVLKLHIDALEYTGGIPYSLLKPVLDGATPSQLYQFEHYNPYMIGDTEHLWQFHVNREFRGETREEMETWRDMYLRCIDEREEKYKAVTANIQKSLEKSVPVRQTKLAYVDVAKPPRAVLRKQMKNGTSRPDAERLMGKSTAVTTVRPPGRAMERPRVSPIFKPKVAPLMQKTLKSIKLASRFKR